MKLAWLTDIHLEFVSPPRLQRFLGEVRDSGADGVVITGDIGTADRLEEWMTLLARELDRPIYFVLGNHDFYHGSVAEVHARARALDEAHPHLFWMGGRVEPVALGDTLLVGQGAWGDARLGNHSATSIRLNDFRFIEELTGLAFPDALRPALARLADASASALSRSLEHAARAPQQKIMVLTHVPPFREACWHDGDIPSEDDDWLPFFACKAVGDVLLAFADAHPERSLRVLCGHCHGEGVAQLRPNLEVLTGGAVYGEPAVQDTIEV